MRVLWEAGSSPVVPPLDQHQGPEDGRAVRTLDPWKRLRPRFEPRASVGSPCTGCAQCEKAKVPVHGYRHTGPASDKPQITRLERHPRRPSRIPSCANNNGAVWVVDG